MQDLPDAPWIREAELQGLPFGDDGPEPMCPVCGKACETIYLYEGSEVVGCDKCLTTYDACIVPECFQQYEKEEQ